MCRDPGQGLGSPPLGCSVFPSCYSVGRPERIPSGSSLSPIAKSGFLRRAWDRLNHASHASNPLVGLNVGSETEFDTVDSRCPSHQNAIDAVPGWNHAFPAEYGVEAGPNVMFNDPRIHWAIEQFGGIAGRRVLEVGPLEGSHTFMLDRA